MFRIRRTIAVLSAAVVLAAACGNSPSGDGAAPTTDSAAPTTAAPATVPAPGSSDRNNAAHTVPATVSVGANSETSDTGA